MIERVSDTEVRIRKARVIHEDELGFSKETGTALTDRDCDRFLDLLDNPPKPTPDLRRAFAKSGFIPLHDSRLHFYLPIATIRQAQGAE
jgi:hypothetical protein